MIRIPDAGRFELRLADGAANPYLLQAALLAAGLDGMKNKRDPGKRLDINMYTEGHTVKDAKKLPLNLLDALRALEKSSVLKDGFGEDVVASYLKLRHGRLERLCRPSHRMGAPDDARLLSSSACRRCATLGLLARLERADAATRAGRRPGAMPAPEAAYDVVIIGGGGHGLATAYYLAKEHGITNVAVLEKGWIGSGNAGRNTTIIRSNYLLPGNIAVLRMVDEAVGGAGAGPQLQRDGQPARRAQPLSLRRAARRLRPARQRHAAARRRRRAARPRAGRARCCPISTSTMRAFRSRAACCSGAAARRATTRWSGAMRARADQRGVDIVQNCEVTGIRIEDGRVVGVETTRGLHPRRQGRARGRRQLLARRRHGRACGCRSRATCCRPSSPKGIKPLVDHVITFGAGHFYISQSDKGGLVFGGDIDGYNSYAQRGNLPASRTCARAAWR